MSTPKECVSQQDDDGPEEGEIEDDEDDIDIILLGGSPQQRRSSTTSTSIDIFQSPISKESYERDIRRHELYRARTARIRRSSGGSKSHSMGSSIRGIDSYRSKAKPRTGLTQGKENRHIHRHKSPLGSHRHRKGSPTRTLADCRDVSPVRRDSSCSSIDSDERYPAVRCSHHKSARKHSPRYLRSKRKSSSSPDNVFVATKRRLHSATKCPLIKVLHSVAKETRLIALETSENNPESSSLKQKLLNMGVMPQHTDTDTFGKSPSISDATVSGMTFIQNDLTVQLPDAVSSDNNTYCKAFENGCTQTETSDVCEEVPVVKPDPEVVTLTDSEDGCCTGLKTLKKQISILKTGELDVLPSVPCASPSKPLVCTSALSPVSDDDDDDDIGRLRLLALQSKKNEQSPPDDADVLQLRLDALKTAFMKKFRIRKKIKIKINTTSLENQPSLLDEIPLPVSSASPASPVSVDEVIVPVDMELAETDDEADSIHSIRDCYSPSDPTESPIHEPCIQDLLPPPPPPDLPLELYYPELGVNADNSMHGIDIFHLPPNDTLQPPPLPPYFRELLGSSDTPYFLPNNDFVPSFPSVSDESCTRDCIPNCEEVLSSSEDFPVIIDNNVNAVATEGSDFSSCSNTFNVNCNLLEVPITSDDSVKHSETKSELNNDCVPTDPSERSNEASIVESHDSLVSLLERSAPSKENIIEADDSQQKIKNRIQRKPSLEEEEQILRQRLLRNMANKRGNIPTICLSKDQETSLPSKVDHVPLKAGASNSRNLKPVNAKTVNVARPEKSIHTIAPTGSSTVKLKATTKILNSALPDNGRVIIDLGEDSDSSGNYSEAEALGLKCAKNRQNWMRYMKELEANPPKQASPGSKANAISGPKLAPRNNHVKVKQVLKDKNYKKPFAENLADLESSVERFLKGVRSSHDAVSKTKQGASSVTNCSNTPVAVKHLPASQQEEYRRLKQQIAKLEKQRQMSVKQTPVPKPVLQGTPIKTSDTQKTKRQINQVLSKTVAEPLKTVNDINVKRAIVTKVVASQPLKIADSHPLLNSHSAKVPREVSVPKNTSALTNVSNINVSKKRPVKPTGNNPQPVKQSTANCAQDNENTEVPQNLQGLMSLEENLITERSHVFNELSALSKLLAQVENSLQAQSNTASEVANLLDKLCLAAGRWRAQNRTVTGLVSRVAHQQKELSQRHRHCVVVAKSCAELGNQLHGNDYRVPIGKADAMRLQLKQVHEKTQDLAKRRTTEQARKSTLEKEAELCLLKLFSNAKSTSNGKLSEHALQSSNPVKDGSNHPSQSTVNTAETLSVNATGTSSSMPSILQHKTDVSSFVRDKVHVNTRSCLPQINPDLMSRVICYRLAQDKVRSAKALLNFSNQKNILKKKKKSRKRVHLKRFHKNEDTKPTLSDMDISSDCEENEKTFKEVGGNTEVVDMSVSPDTSLSPQCVESGTSDHSWRKSVNSGINSTGFSKNIETPTSAAVNLSKQKRNPKTCNLVKGLDRTFAYELPFHTEKMQETQSQNQTEKVAVPIVSRNVFKDYVSPLGGLKILSNNSKEVSEEGDLFAILCPYDLNGKCQDSECRFKHQK